jgi:hypothetical protein
MRTNLSREHLIEDLRLVGLSHEFLRLAPYVVAMGFLDRLFGTNSDAEYRETTNRVREASAARSEDEVAVERYRYLLRTAPPETIEKVHEEAFTKLSPEQRKMLFTQLSADAPRGEAPRGDDAHSLAVSATRSEMRQPGTMEKSLGNVSAAGAGPAGAAPAGAAPGFGSMFGSSLLGSIAGYVIASTLMSAFLPSFAGDSGAGDGSQAGSEGGNGSGDAGAGGGDSSGEFASADGGGFDGGGMADGGFGDGGFGDFGGMGDFGL